MKTDALHSLYNYLERINNDINFETASISDDMEAHSDAIMFELAHNSVSEQRESFGKYITLINRYLKHFFNEFYNRAIRAEFPVNEEDKGSRESFILFHAGYIYPDEPGGYQVMAASDIIFLRSRINEWLRTFNSENKVLLASLESGLEKTNGFLVEKDEPKKRIKGFKLLSNYRPTQLYNKLKDFKLIDCTVGQFNSIFNGGEIRTPVEWKGNANTFNRFIDHLYNSSEDGIFIVERVEDYWETACACFYGRKRDGKLFTKEVVMKNKKHLNTNQFKEIKKQLNSLRAQKR